MASILSWCRADAQVCVTFSLIDEGSIVPIDVLEVSIIDKQDTLVSTKNNGQVCFALELGSNEPIDILIEFDQKVILLPDLHPNFLRLSSREPKWNVVYDRAPFIKKDYPGIQRWKGVATIVLLELSSKDGVDMVMLYKRRKDGSHIVD